MDNGADLARAPSRRAIPSAAPAAEPPTAHVGAVPCVAVVSEPSRQYFPQNTYPCQPVRWERGSDTPRVLPSVHEWGRVPTTRAVLEPVMNLVGLGDGK